MEDAFFANVGRRHVCFCYDNILYIEAKGNYATIVDTANQKTLVNHTLNCLAEFLPSGLFVRIHRSYIVSIKRIREFEKGIVLIGEEEIPINHESYKMLCERLHMPPKECPYGKGRMKKRSKQGALA